MGFNLVKYLVSKDAYGHKIGVHYRGSGTYQTKLGAAFTMATKLLSIVNLTLLIIAFYDGSKQSSNIDSSFADRFNSPEFFLSDYSAYLSLLV